MPRLYLPSTSSITRSYLDLSPPPSTSSPPSPPSPPSQPSPPSPPYPQPSSVLADPTWCLTFDLYCLSCVCFLVTISVFWGERNLFDPFPFFFDKVLFIGRFFLTPVVFSELFVGLFCVWVCKLNHFSYVSLSEIIVVLSRSLWFFFSLFLVSWVLAFS